MVKVLSQGKPQKADERWWLTVINVCAVCGTSYVLEEHDAVQRDIGQPAADLTVRSSCPNCGAITETFREKAMRAPRIGV